MIGTRKQGDLPDAGRHEAMSRLPSIVAVEHSVEIGTGKRRSPMLSETHSETSAPMMRKARKSMNLNLFVLRVI
jgi:hypothetical protein